MLFPLICIFSPFWFILCSTSLPVASPIRVRSTLSLLATVLWNICGTFLRKIWESQESNPEQQDLVASTLCYDIPYSTIVLFGLFFNFPIRLIFSHSLTNSYSVFSVFRAIFHCSPVSIYLSFNLYSGISSVSFATNCDQACMYSFSLCFHYLHSLSLPFIP